MLGILLNLTIATAPHKVFDDLTPEQQQVQGHSIARHVFVNLLTEMVIPFSMIPTFEVYKEKYWDPIKKAAINEIVKGEKVLELLGVEDVDKALVHNFIIGSVVHANNYDELTANLKSFGRLAEEAELLTRRFYRARNGIEQFLNARAIQQYFYKVFPSVLKDSEKAG